eukprot:SAG11_NODE_389_length_9870_cov_7.646812_9_plen_107_part_00
MDAAPRARERVRQVRGDADAMVEAAGARGSAAAQRAMDDASERLRVVVHRVHRADDDLAIAGAATDDAVVEALESAAEDANAHAPWGGHGGRVLVSRATGRGAGRI